MENEYSDILRTEHKLGFDKIRSLVKGKCSMKYSMERAETENFSVSREEISSRLELTDEMRMILMFEDSFPSQGFEDCMDFLLPLKAGSSYIDTLSLGKLRKALDAVRRIVGFFDSVKDGLYPCLKEMSSPIMCFPLVIDRIDSIIDRFGEIRDTASGLLADIRRSLREAETSIARKALAVLQKAQQEGLVDKDATVSMRDGKMLIPVPASNKRKLRGYVYDESATGKTVFIEPDEVVELDNRVRELLFAQEREIMRILSEFTDFLRPYIDDIVDSFRFLGEIDFIRAKASLALDFIAGKPIISDNGELNLRKARHPILEKALKKEKKEIVPLTLTLTPQRHIMLISGPNAGGKSVCLKTVGLLQYMMQCGMPVPLREDSVMGIFEDIFIDIGDEQSLEDELSTYSGHLQNMKQMMKSGSARSLLLIDEFGSGTEPLIGGAIAEAVLDRLVQKQVSGIITTHYQNLKQYAQAHPAVVNGAMLYDRANMQPLFRLQIGTPGSSFAIEIARKIGLPADVIDAATQIAGAEYIQTDKYVQDINRDKAYWENKRKNIRNQEKQLQENMARYQHDMETLQAQRREIIAQAKAEAQEMLRQSNAQIENTIRQIKEAQAERETTQEARARLESYKQSLASAEEQDAAIARKIEQIRRRAERRKERRANAAAGTPDKQPGKAAEKPRALQAGDTVHIDGQNTVGQIVRIEGKRAYVQYGSMTARVELSRLRPATAPSPTPSAPSPNAPTISAALHAAQQRFHPDIDIRGQHVDEALPVLARYIDDAIQLGQPRVRFLHGTGAGALREAVRNYLASVPGVRDFRDEHVQFGGAGITVVDLD